MSPEQAEGDPVDRRADIFALGVVLWECLTMQRLFRGEHDLATLKLVRKAQIEPPSRFAHDVPRELDAIVLRMLARPASARYASCGQVAAALLPLVHDLGGDEAGLRRFVAELGPIAHDVPADDDDASVTRTVPGQGEDSSLPAEALRLRGGRWGGVVIAGALAAAVLGFGVMRLSRTAEREEKATGAPAAVATAATASGSSPSPSSPSPSPSTSTSPSTPSSPSPSPSPSSSSSPSSRAPAETGQAQASAAAAPAAAAPAATETAVRGDRARPVELRFRGTRGAQVQVDGVVIGEIPVAVRLPAVAGGKRVVLVRKAGHVTQQIVVAGDRAMKLTVDLTRRSGAAAKGERSPDLFDPFRN
jgi:hypothetical protein